MQSDSLTIGTRVSYEDMANPRCAGVILDIEVTRWGVQYVIEWGGYRSGEITKSDCRQSGWRVEEDEAPIIETMPARVDAHHAELNRAARECYALRNQAEEHGLPTLAASYMEVGDVYFSRSLAITAEWES